MTRSMSSHSFTNSLSILKRVPCPNKTVRPLDTAEDLKVCQCAIAVKVNLSVITVVRNEEAFRWRNDQKSGEFNPDVCKP